MSVRITLALTVGLVGCNTPATSPVSVAPTPTVEDPVAPPAIAGTVVVSSTDMPPPTGAIVYLEDAAKEPGALTTATIDIYHKQLTPFIAVVTTGGTVTFGNLDGLTHHIFSPDIQKWDTGTLEKNVKASRTFDSPGPISLLCNIHPEMLGYVFVIPSTYFGRVGSDGKYAIRNVPLGTYRVTAWAPRIPTSTQTVTVRKDIVTADFVLHPPPK